MTGTGAGSEQVPLMLVHGAWLSARSWENFAGYFGGRGSPCPPGVAAQARRRRGAARDADELAGLGLTEIVEHYEELIRGLDRPPVLIGHSFGGLIVELLLDRGLGRAGVAMSPAPPKGIGAAVLDAEGRRARPRASVEAARRRHADARGVHLRLRQHVHARGRSLRVRALRGSRDRPDLLRGRLREPHLHPPTEVHFRNGDRAPLLIVGAEKDNAVPGVGLASAQRKKYEKSTARTDYLESKGGRTSSWSVRAGMRSRRRSTPGSRVCSTHRPSPRVNRFQAEEAGRRSARASARSSRHQTIS